MDASLRRLTQLCDQWNGCAANGTIDAYALLFSGPVTLNRYTDPKNPWWMPCRHPWTWPQCPEFVPIVPRGLADQAALLDDDVRNMDAADLGQHVEEEGLWQQPYLAQADPAPMAQDHGTI